MFNINGTADDYRRGYEDAYYWRRPSPNSVKYFEGYERGVYVREIYEEMLQEVEIESHYFPQVMHHE